MVNNNSTDSLGCSNIYALVAARPEQESYNDYGLRDTGYSIVTALTVGGPMQYLPLFLVQGNEPRYVVMGHDGDIACDRVLSLVLDRFVFPEFYGEKEYAIAAQRVTVGVLEVTA